MVWKFKFIIRHSIKLLDAIGAVMGKPVSGRDSEDAVSNFGGVL